jgi:hypothetical protein
MDVEASQDVLIDVFERLENFFRRLESYTDVPPTPAMTDMMVKIMVEVLDIFGTATKEMRESRASKVILPLGLLVSHLSSEKFIKRVAGITKLEDGLKRLEKMTNEEARMANAELLRRSHDIDKKVQGVGVQVKNVDKKIEVIEAKVQKVVDGVQRMVHNLHDETSLSSVPVFTDGRVSNTTTGHGSRERLRKWRSPPDPSTSHNIACECQHEGTTKWFCQGGSFEKWKVAGSLLWVHGKRTLPYP